MGKKNIPFSKPWIDGNVIAEVNHCLTTTRWLSTGPKVSELEEKIGLYLQCRNVICVNSWSSGAQMILKWFGVGPGDEVIIPSYTYAATALCVMALGAKPVMTDIGNNYHISVKDVRKKINKRTKVIMPVDYGGIPCNYDEIRELVESDEIKGLFNAKNETQKLFNRILILGDMAHSLGTKIGDEHVWKKADIGIHSLHSAKNITAGEGGVIMVNEFDHFDSDQLHKTLKLYTLNGQTKTALEKDTTGNWKYDIILEGLKINMPDINAAIVLGQLKSYESQLLPERQRLYSLYQSILTNSRKGLKFLEYDISIRSSCHLFPILLPKTYTEKDRDSLINYLSSFGIKANVHYVPLPMLTLFKRLNYKIHDYPKSYDKYCRTLTLPLYNGLEEEDVKWICDLIIKFMNNHVQNSKKAN